MTEKVLTPLGVAEERRLAIDSEKNALEEVRVDLFGASRDVISSYKRYSRARTKVSEKRSSRNLSRLSRAQTELGARVESYNAARLRMNDALASVVSAHDAYLVELTVATDLASAKKSTRSLDAYVRRIERFIEKTDDSVACIMSYYTLCICGNDAGDENTALPQNLASVAGNFEPSPSFVHTNQVEVSPVSIDIGPTVERAVERAIAELSDTLEKKIAQTLNSVELPLQSGQDSLSLSDAADKLVSAHAAIKDVISELDKIIEEISNMSDKCRKIVEMQRSTARELQGIEVKQRLVNQEQAELAEAQENVLERQKILSEKLGAQTENEDASNG